MPLSTSGCLDLGSPDILWPGQDLCSSKGLGAFCLLSVFVYLLYRPWEAPRRRACEEFRKRKFEAGGLLKPSRAGSLASRSGACEVEVAADPLGIEGN